MLLSVIVPVYNAEKYLPRCLDSLLNQGLEEDEYEIICVDDGSTDGSLSLLMRYAERNACIKVLTQAHSGLGITRNTALDQTKGVIITFCDADDYLIPNGLRYLLDTFWDNQTDVLCHASTTIDYRKSKRWIENNDVSGSILYQGGGRRLYEQSPRYFVWNTLISRRFIMENQLRFNSMVMTEDSYFMLELMMKDPRTKDVSSNIYRYMVTQGQLTQQRDGALMRQCIDSYLLFIERLQHYGLDIVVRKQLVPFYSRVLSACLNKKEYDQLIKQLKMMSLHVSPYCFYYPMSWIHRKLFVSYILPHLSRG